MLAAVILLGVAGALAQPAGDGERTQIRELIAGTNPQELRNVDIARYRNALDRFYAAGGYVPQWFGAASPWRAGLAELEAAPSHGLDPKDYDTDWLVAETQAVAEGKRAPQDIARVDVALTAAFFHLLSDLHVGRVTPKQAGFDLSPGDKPLDLPASLHHGIATGNLHDVVGAAEPPFALYQRLKQALARYRMLAATPLPPLPSLSAGKQKVEPGGEYAGLAAVMERLRLVGDLPEGASVPDTDHYTGQLVDAVRSFQDRHGLKPDGVLGRDTLAQLSVAFAERVRSIELSLERLRWLPDLPPSPLIAVNIPSFRLWAFANAHDDSAAQLTMAVIVGRAVKARETPIFIGEMRYIEFSPYWNVPPPIQRSEIVPKLQTDPGYWEREELEAVPVQGGAPITSIDAATLEGLKAGTLRVRQRPGAKNALGGVKFVLPNTMDIYLHSTPAQQLFEQTRRDFSHGCIRVADPPALAEFVLRDQPEWTSERITAAMAAGKTTTARLTQPIPVVLFYTTAIVDHTGRVFFQQDIYGYDRRLELALKMR